LVEVLLPMRRPVEQDQSAVGQRVLDGPVRQPRDPPVERIGGRQRQRDTLPWRQGKPDRPR
jgi:hypothetical protein